MKRVASLKFRRLPIAPAPNLGAIYNSVFIEGMWLTHEKFIMILDIDKVFSVDEVIDFGEQVSETK